MPAITGSMRNAVRRTLTIEITLSLVEMEMIDRARLHEPRASFVRRSALAAADASLRRKKR